VCVCVVRRSRRQFTLFYTIWERTRREALEWQRKAVAGEQAGQDVELSHDKLKPSLP
jgi:hypothetical protein